MRKSGFGGKRKSSFLPSLTNSVFAAPPAPATDSDVQAILDQIWNQIHRAGGRNVTSSVFPALERLEHYMRLRLALYFVGVPMGRIGSEGSAADLDALVSRLMVLYPGNQSIPMRVTRCCFKDVRLSKFFILDKLKEVVGSMPGPSQLVSSDCGIEEVFDRLIKTHKRGPIILDECQGVQDTLVNRFELPTARTRSLLDVSVPALLGFRTRIQEECSHFGGLYEEADLKDYASRILKDSSASGTATAYFVEYANEVSTRLYRPMAVNTLRSSPLLDRTVYKRYYLTVGKPAGLSRIGQGYEMIGGDDCKRYVTRESQGQVLGTNIAYSTSYQQHDDPYSCKLRQLLKFFLMGVKLYQSGEGLF
ncbi:hypothetical protein SELMODRAFT_404919 [Selaginella moellendorffii]|uniref:Uncharacterized protein n=1 Tax=Selaginella moellendorffii TaxID=88036 RepID=D8QXT1_SELML|nr:hypothetical protein SELMODRAFT_404919 [Selaginella moellendorffii]